MWLVRESGKRRGYPVRGLGVHVLVSELRDEGRRLVRDERGGSVYASVGFGDLAFGDGQLKRIPNAYLAFSSADPLRVTLVPEGGTPTTTTRDRARNHSGLNGWILAVGCLYLV